MVFLCWARPSPQQQKNCLMRSSDFNYDAKYKGATAKSASSLKEDRQLSKDGFSLNHARVLVGTGLQAFEKGKSALQTWRLTFLYARHIDRGWYLDTSYVAQLVEDEFRHFGLNWAFVDPKTPIQSGQKFCVCVKEFLPWLMMPLQVVYVKESQNKKKSLASFCFGGGTLQGHLLAGEERFSIEIDENNQVWYEILSISKPAHFLSFIGYPYVQFRQKVFAHQSTDAVLKHVNA